MKVSQKTWQSKVPANCQICGKIIAAEFVDGALKEIETWAILCPDCHYALGIGIGTGKGQRYRLQDDEKYHKIEG